MKEKAGRNKTIDFSLEEGKEYLERCIKWENLKESIGRVSVDCVKNQFILGDSFEVMEHLPEKCVDLLIVDPPYNLSKDYHGNKFGRTVDEKYREYTVRWIEKVLPLLKKNATVYVCCDWQSSLVIGPLMQEYFDVKNRITWQREKGRGAGSNWKNGMEDIWYAVYRGGEDIDSNADSDADSNVESDADSNAESNGSADDGRCKDRDYIFNLDAVKIRRKVIAPYKSDGKPKDWEETPDGKYRDTCPSNFWDDISIPYWSMPENTAHPTQKPEKLMAKLILASSNEGNLILDPFAGSGTTAVTAKKLGRNYIAIEQNELYGAWAQKRLKMADSDRTIQGYADGVFWERNTASLQKKHR